MNCNLVDAVPTFAFTAVYHIADARSATESLDSHLAQAGTILDCPMVDPDSIGIACYQAITNVSWPRKPAQSVACPAKAGG